VVGRTLDIATINLAGTAAGRASWPTQREQAVTSSRMPFLFPHLAPMPDAHLSKGATVGSFIPERGAGVDLTRSRNWALQLGTLDSATT